MFSCQMFKYVISFICRNTLTYNILFLCIFTLGEEAKYYYDAWCVGERQSDDPNINKGEVNYQGEERLLSFCRSMIVRTRQHHNQRKQWRYKIFWADIAPGQLEPLKEVCQVWVACIGLCESRWILVILTFCCDTVALVRVKRDCAADLLLHIL